MYAFKYLHECSTSMLCWVKTSLLKKIVCPLLTDCQTKKMVGLETYFFIIHSGFFSSTTTYISGYFNLILIHMWNEIQHWHWIFRGKKIPPYETIFFILSYIIHVFKVGTARENFFFFPQKMALYTIITSYCTLLMTYMANSNCY